MTKYSYSGPVVEFGKCIMNNWNASTCANSKAKARTNLVYQFNKRFNRLPSAKIALPGEIVEA